MERLFINLLNLSIAAGWLILAILLFRLIIGRKIPKWILCVLWGIVGLRLVLPFSFESRLSLIPKADVIPQSVVMENLSDVGNSDSGSNISVTDPGKTDSTKVPERLPETGTSVTVPDEIINSDGLVTDEHEQNVGTVVPPTSDAVVDTPAVKDQSTLPQKTDSAKGSVSLSTVAVTVWLCGFIFMSCYSAVSFIKLKRKMSTATKFYGNIKQSENVISPFVLGLFKPTIYIPYNVDSNYMAYVIEHERSHIKRGDHITKMIAFVILSVYWFNPLVWVAYILFCRDIELACDEKVIGRLDIAERKAYSYALLKCSVRRRTIAACPVAFGESGVKERVKNVMSYRKPTFWIITLAILSCIIVAVCFLTYPLGEEKAVDDGAESNMTMSESVIRVETYYMKNEVLTQVREYHVQLTEGAESDILDYSEENLICTVKSIDPDSKTVTFSLNLPLTVDGEDMYEVEVKAGNTYTASVAYDNYRNDYIFEVKDIEDTTVYATAEDEEPIGEFGKKMEIESYMNYLVNYIHEPYRKGDDVKDINMLYMYAMFCLDNMEKLSFVEEDPDVYGISVPEANLLWVSKNLIGRDIDLSEYHDSFEAGIDRYDETDGKYFFTTATDYWFGDRYDIPNAFPIKIFETESSVIVRTTVYNWPIMGVTKNYREMEYRFSKVIDDGFMFYQLEEVNEIGTVPGGNIDPDNVRIVMIDNEPKDGVYDAFYLYNGEHRLVYECNSVDPEPSHVIFDDVTHDGIKDIIIIIRTAGGTGVNHESVYVIDGNDYTRHPVEDINSIIESHIDFSSDDAGFYIDTAAGKYVIEKAMLETKPDELAANIVTSNVYRFKVEDGILKCTVPCQVGMLEFYGELEISYRFVGNVSAMNYANNFEFNSAVYFAPGKAEDEEESFAERVMSSYFAASQAALQCRNGGVNLTGEVELVGDVPYRKAVAFDTYEQLKTYYLDLFSPELAEELISMRFMDYEGTLYGVDRDKETDPGKGRESYEIVRINDDKYVLRVNVELLGDWLTEGVDREVIDHQTYDFNYELINGKWVFTSFPEVR